jgi:DHA2 family lincomycin resistance protein-like MFS transporter
MTERTLSSESGATPENGPASSTSERTSDLTAGQAGSAPAPAGPTDAGPARASAKATATSNTDDAATQARNRVVIGVLIVSAFVVILNETIMGVALPTLDRDLNIPVSTGQWLTTGFMLTMAVVIPITGFLLQRFNTRPVFIAAMTLFSIGTLIAAMAPGFEILLAGRIVQATGTAIMMPLLMTTVMTIVPPASRGRMMGNISIVISVAPAVGPTISGIILNTLSWRWMFIIVLPIAVAALIIGSLLIKNVTTPRKMPLDVLSVVLSAFAFGGLVYGLNALGEGANAEAAEGGSASAMPSWLPLVVGIVALGLFIWRQIALQKKDDALLDLRTFRSKNFTISIILMAVSMMAMFGSIIVLPIYLQSVLQLEPLETGLLLLPGGLVMGIASPFVGRLYDKFGPTPLIVPASALVSLVFWGLSMATESTPFFLILSAHIALSIGLAFLFTPLLTSALGSVRPQLYSHASAIVGTVQQLAGGAGTVLFIGMMTAQTIALSTAGASEVVAGAGGARAAFLTGAIISLFAVAAAFFVRKPADVIGDDKPVMH